ncbi:hypothetical protein [Streptomyces sp. NBC_00989]|uniref:hypothetical protein n=1 Tax=Streptomyces sp. NBC_00989 TaxID=2903705 RepID=UPI00386BD73A|nr:hypothetical protein OG714_44400 [Streptomyces sp. NBC_00989]
MRNLSRFSASRAGRAAALAFSAAALTLIGAIPAGAAAPANVSPKEPRPDCGGSVYLTSQQYSGGKWTFKIVGVDLEPWLGKSYGTMDYQAGVLGGSNQVTGSVNASPTAGARTGVISVTISSGKTGYVEVEIYKGNYEACTTQFNHEV